MKEQSGREPVLLGSLPLLPSFLGVDPIVWSVDWSLRLCYENCMYRQRAWEKIKIIKMQRAEPVSSITIPV
jgi:hypothetical protein